MKTLRRWVLLMLLLVGFPVMAQTSGQPQTAAGLQGYNAKWANGTAIGFYGKVSSGLVWSVGPGTVMNGTAVPTYASATTLALTNNTTNYVFLDRTASYAAAFNTTGFICGSPPLAVVVTSGGAVVTYHDVRGAPTGCPLGGPLPRALAFTIFNPAGLSAGTSSLSYDLFADIPVICTIARWSLAIDVGTITVKFWKVATGGTSIPTSANSINTSGVSISSGTLVQSTMLSDFTTLSVGLHDSMIMDITAVTSATIVNGVLECDELQ